MPCCCVLGLLLPVSGTSLTSLYCNSSRRCTHKLIKTWDMLQQTAWSKPKLLVQRRLQLLLVVYLYNVEAETFLPIPDMPAELPAQIAAAKQVLQQISGGDCPGFCCFAIFECCPHRYCCCIRCTSSAHSGRLSSYGILPSK